jgi:hypothetical protein
MRIAWILSLVVLIVAGCGRKKQEATPKQGSASAAPPRADADAAPAPDAAAGSGAVASRPTDQQAIDAVKAWATAIAAKDAAKAAAAAAVPFRFTDHYTSTNTMKACKSTPAADATALAEITACLAASPQVRGSLAVDHASFDTAADAPASLMGDDGKAWTAFAQLTDASHALVTVAGGDPEHPADVLYALFAVRLVDGSAKVDAAFLAYSLEGE